MSFEQAIIAQWRRDPAFAALVAARHSLEQHGQVPREGISDALRDSWRRCLAAGLRPDAAPPLRRLDEDALRRCLATRQRLLDAAAPELERLNRALGSEGAIVGLADADGVSLRVLALPQVLKLIETSGAWPGTCWPEHEQGTNAVGTVLIDKRPFLIRGGEHFYTRDAALSCAGMPIFDVAGELIGVLTLTVLMAREMPDALGWLLAAARAIERHLFRTACGDGALIDVHRRRDQVGTPLAGQLLFDSAGILRALNDEARRELGQPRARLIGRRFDEVFDRDFAVWAATASHGVRLWQLPDNRAIFVAADPWASAPAPRPGISVNRPAAASLDALALDEARQRQRLEKAAAAFAAGTPVLIEGEAGVGKTLLARALHARLDPAAPFIVVNSAAVPEALLAIELFGQVESTTPGEERPARLGRLREADGGTLLLKEVDALPLAIQARLLRALQERQVTPVGGRRGVPIEVRLISATRRGLAQAVARHAFREDLQARLRGHHLSLPPLREHPRLTRAIVDQLRRHAAALGVPAGRIAPPLLAALGSYRWPGNLAELAMVLRTALVLREADESQIDSRHLLELFAATLVRGAPAVTPGAPAATLREAEIGMIVEALDRANGNVSAAATALGISRVSIYRKLKAAGLPHRRPPA